MDDQKNQTPNNNSFSAVPPMPQMPEMSPIDTPAAPAMMPTPNSPVDMAMPSQAGGFSPINQTAPTNSTTIPTTPNAPDLTQKKKKNLMPIIGGIVAVFLVAGIATASYFVSQRLNTTASISPNAPKRSQAANCTGGVVGDGQICGSDGETREFDSGGTCWKEKCNTFSPGCYIWQSDSNRPGPCVAPPPAPENPPAPGVVYDCRANGNHRCCANTNYNEARSCDGIAGVCTKGSVDNACQWNPNTSCNPGSCDKYSNTPAIWKKCNSSGTAYESTDYTEGTCGSTPAGQPGSGSGGSNSGCNSGYTCSQSASCNTPNMAPPDGGCTDSEGLAGNCCVYSGSGSSTPACIAAGNTCVQGSDTCCGGTVCRIDLTDPSAHIDRCQSALTTASGSGSSGSTCSSSSSGGCSGVRIGGSASTAGYVCAWNNSTSNGSDGKPVCRSIPSATDPASPPPACSGKAVLGSLCTPTSSNCCEAANQFCTLDAPNVFSYHCSQADSLSVRCPGGGVCNRIDAFHCSGLTDSQCLENKAQDVTMEAAQTHAGSCGQIDYVCRGGTNDGHLCGSFAVINSGCGGGSTTTTTNDGGNTTITTTNTVIPVAPMCVAVTTMAKVNGSFQEVAAGSLASTVKVGDTVRLVVTGNDAAVGNARFNVSLNGADISSGGFVEDGIMSPVPASGIKQIYKDIVVKAGTYAISAYVDAAVLANTTTTTTSTVPVATSTVGTPPTPARKVWTSMPPTTGLKIVQFTEPNGSTIRSSAYSGDQIWNWTCVVGGACTATAQQTVAQAFANTGLVFNPALPSGDFQAVAAYVLGGNLTRVNMYKGSKYYAFSYDFGTRTYPNALVGDIFVNGLTFNDLDTGAAVQMPSDNIDAANVVMSNDTTARVNVYKGNRYWGYQVNLPNATSNPPSTVGGAVVAGSGVTKNLAKGFLDFVEDPNGAWTGHPLASAADINDQNWKVDSVTEYYYMENGVKTLRVNVFRGDRYWGYTCLVGQKCKARITRLISESWADVVNPTVQGASIHLPAASKPKINNKIVK